MYPTGHDQTRAVSTESKAAQLGAPRFTDGLATLDVPELQSSVAAGDDPPTIVSEGHPVHSGAVLCIRLQRAQHATMSRVPQQQFAATAAAHDEQTLATESRAQHSIVMSCQYLQRLTGVCIPKSQRAVLAGAEN